MTVYRKAVKKGFEFTLMVVGESGLGKSTLINSMFLTNIYSSHSPSLQNGPGQTLKVEAHRINLEEKGIKLDLTVVDTPGFGVAVDNSNCWEPIINYIDEQFEDYLEGETRVHRESVFTDTRVHACLYFIAPTGHGLKPLDVEFMKKLQYKVNIIPVVGKADCCTKIEIAAFKTKVLKQLKELKIATYDFPASELTEKTMWMRDRLPFAVVGSNTLLELENGGRTRGREYSWGTVNIENPDHCDFSPLRSLLLSFHMQDLREMTHTRHYEKYRSSRLTDHSSYPSLNPSKSLPGLLAVSKDDVNGMVAANYTSQDLSPSPSSLLEFKEYQEYKEYQESRGYTQPHLGISSLKEQQGEESRKKSWIVSWNQGRVNLQQKHLPKPNLLSKVKGRYNSMSMAELRSKTTENISSNKTFRQIINTLNSKKTKQSSQQ
ncbi:septin-1 [Eurytemora carolleeae]|uniref:septin-1 n=1 Tax=Eurytemora carolleeae TaxID=1294199 RepID=UPI000C768726|nr:septin-1 [Eurytemora carolleeae]|eukprot:XP_023345614.1 septin-1-like [Eurytemora affinis]